MQARERGSAQTSSYVFLRRPVPDYVKVDTAGAALLHRVGVAYPQAAVEKRIEGVVAVEASLDEAGNVEDARVLSGPLELRKAALESVLQWHFASGGGGSTRLVNIAFKLPAQMEKVAIAYRPSAANEEQQEQASAMRLLEKQIAEAREKAEPVNDSALIRELEKLRASQASLTTLGSTLTAIRIEGLPDTLRNELQARIPVHAGETLTKESIERTNTAVRQFDEHLEVRVRPSGEGQAELVIVGPASEPGRMRGVRRQMP
jgi:TonB family protein